MERKAKGQVKQVGERRIVGSKGINNYDLIGGEKWEGKKGGSQFNLDRWFLWIQRPGLHRRIAIGRDRGWHIKNFVIAIRERMRWNGRRPLDLFRSMAGNAPKADRENTPSHRKKSVYKRNARSVQLLILISAKCFSTWF